MHQNFRHRMAEKGTKMVPAFKPEGNSSSKESNIAVMYPHNKGQVHSLPNGINTHSLRGAVNPCRSSNY